MIFLQAPDADRIGLKPVNERCAKVQARPGNRTELAETRHHRALVLPNREKRRHHTNQKKNNRATSAIKPTTLKRPLLEPPALGSWAIESCAVPAPACKNEAPCGQHQA